MLFLMVFGRFPEKFTFGIFFPIQNLILFAFRPSSDRKCFLLCYLVQSTLQQIYHIVIEDPQNTIGFVAENSL